ncbi:putative protein kinase RLK-Pelle-CrRLK1L-1 family [Helianthus annuus]|uniref:Protein kinase domain-containing protein n=1 Tax=Helianthus annuus TaxID=4232 RepID=A0A9K3IZP0_HELAN|nr:putative protein kinase RLK-Pelle-CrRLK1L-1 family [Helianthus annuus]
MAIIKESDHLRIPFQDIEKATGNFSTLIGRGGFGSVYRGQVSLSGELTPVAVKKLDNLSRQGLKEFLTEIRMLSRYKHQNLVSLVGFSEEQNEKYLIYEYAERGSLDSYLKPTKPWCPLTWKQRINICVDAARGLDHLHNHVAEHERVIHRDIKSANILIDHNWKAMIADFGLSKIGRTNEDDTYLITNACGTPGYWDPAYFNTGILTKESDIYSFGVVLIEVLCGRLCIINANNVNKEERFLTPLALRYYKEEKLDLIMDRYLKYHMKSDSMKVFLEIAFQCLQDVREQRPSMDLVLQELEKALKLRETEELAEMQAFANTVENKKWKKKQLSPQDAIMLIQRKLRAYLIRKSRVLCAHRELGIVKGKLKELMALLNDSSYRRRVARDADERHKFSEKIIVLFLTLDAIEGANIMARAVKRSMVDDLEAMLDIVDPQPRGGDSLSLNMRIIDMLAGVIQKEVVEGVAQAFAKRAEKNKGKKKELSPEDAAMMIQISFRVYLIRRGQALRALRELAIAKGKLKELKALFKNPTYHGRLAHDEEERQKFSERIIVLLLTVDATEGANILVRHSKRSMLDELEAMLDIVDPQSKRVKSLTLKRRTSNLPDGGVIQKEVAEGVTQVVHVIELYGGSDTFKRMWEKNKMKKKKKELSPQDAATMIQIMFRAYLIRKSMALRALRELAIAKGKLKEVKALFNNYSYSRRLTHDEEERQKFSERIIVLLLTVDATEGANIMARAVKRSMVDDLEAMLDIVDPQPRGGDSLSLNMRIINMLAGLIQKEAVEGVAQVCPKSKYI